MVDAPATTIRHEFDVATAIRPSATPGTYDVDIDAGFTVGPKPNGGYLLATIARAAGNALGLADSAHRDALAATAHFLWAPDPGPATVEVDVLRTGRSASQVRATMVQGDRRCVDVTFTMGTLPEAGTEPVWSSVVPFDVAPYDQCIRVPADPPGNAFKVSIMERSDLRLDPAVLSFAAGKPSGRGELRGWISLADDRPIDPLALLFFLDALPPATFEISLSGWVPTLSLTTYLRATPAPGPLRVRMRAQQVSGGRVDEVCELWDSAGHLVGQATQLAAIRFNDPESIAPFPG